MGWSIRPGGRAAGADKCTELTVREIADVIGKSAAATQKLLDRGLARLAGGGRTWVEFVAFCAWDRSWLAATEFRELSRSLIGDPPRLASGRPRWPYVPR